MPPDPALLARFTRDLHALTGPLTPATRLGVAVSGGPDSLALLLLAQAAHPGRVAAATVDHQLRPQSPAEAAAVARLCADLGLDHATLSAPVAPAGEGLQAAARHARYAALARWADGAGVTHLLTAHHADDQAETLLMRLLRGSGIAGVASIRGRSPLPLAGGVGGGPVRTILVRPLLAWRRAELAAVVGAAGLTPVDDPANTDPRHDRARLRARLAAAPWLDPAPLAASAAHLAQAEDAIAWAADRLWTERAARDGPAGDGGWTLDAADLPSEFAHRLALRALQAVDPRAAPRGPELARLLVTLDEGGTATLAGVRARGGRPWRFAPAPPRRR